MGGSALLRDFEDRKLLGLCGAWKLVDGKRGKRLPIGVKDQKERPGELRM